MPFISGTPCKTILLMFVCKRVSLLGIGKHTKWFIVFCRKIIDKRWYHAGGIWRFVGRRTSVMILKDNGVDAHASGIGRGDWKRGTGKNRPQRPLDRNFLMKQKPSWVLFYPKHNTRVKQTYTYCLSRLRHSGIIDNGTRIFVNLYSIEILHVQKSLGDNKKIPWLCT